MSLGKDIWALEQCWTVEGSGDFCDSAGCIVHNQTATSLGGLDRELFPVGSFVSLGPHMVELFGEAVETSRGGNVTAGSRSPGAGFQEL